MEKVRLLTAHPSRLSAIIVNVTINYVVLKLERCFCFDNLILFKTVTKIVAHGLEF